MIIKSSLGLSFGVVFSVLLFKRRAWPAWVGLGFGAGRAWEEADCMLTSLVVLFFWFLGGSMMDWKLWGHAGRGCMLPQVLIKMLLWVCMLALKNIGPGFRLRQLQSRRRASSSATVSSPDGLTQSQQLPSAAVTLPSPRLCADRLVL